MLKIREIFSSISYEYIICYYEINIFIIKNIYIIVGLF